MPCVGTGSEKGDKTISSALSVSMFPSNLPDDALAKIFFLKWLAFTHVLAKNILTLQDEENSLQKMISNHLGQFCSEKDQTERAQHSFLLES